MGSNSITSGSSLPSNKKPPLPPPTPHFRKRKHFFIILSKKKMKLLIYILILRKLQTIPRIIILIIVLQRRSLITCYVFTLTHILFSFFFFFRAFWFWQIWNLRFLFYFNKGSKFSEWKFRLRQCVWIVFFIESHVKFLFNIPIYCLRISDCFNVNHFCCLGLCAPEYILI